MRNHLLQREHAFQAILVIDHIHVVYFVHVLGLHAHLLHALGHTPVLVHDNHFGAHQATGSVVVILQQVDDVAGLLHVVDVRDYVVAVLLVEFLYKVNGIVRVEVFQLLCNILVGHIIEQLLAVVLVKLHKHLGSSLLVEQLVQELSLLGVKVVEKLGNIGRVQPFEQLASLIHIVGGHNLFHLLQIILGVFFHKSSLFVPRPTTGAPASRARLKH